MTTPSARSLTRLARLATLPVAAFALLATALPAAAEDHGSEIRVGKASVSDKVPETDFEMPFPCGQAWTGTTRASHSPSARSVDWNRTDDYGAPVVAAAPGVVTVAATVDKGGYGKWVLIDHGNDESTIYGHLSAVIVKVGQRVDQGTQIGNVGSTGNSTGPHLHFEERDSGSDMWPYFHQKKYAFGTELASQNCVDVPLAANMNGGPEAETVVYTRGSTATFTIPRPKKKPRVVRLGVGTDDPLLGDWDGDGFANVGIRSADTSTFTLKTADGFETVVFGTKADRPISGDWDGDGTWDVGLHRPATGAFLLRFADGTIRRVRLGTATDLPVTGDWNGDGVTDLGVFDQSTATFTLRVVDADGLAWFAPVEFGAPGDLPVVGDWDGNGKTDLGTWDPATAKLSQRLAKAPTAARATTQQLVVGHPR